MKKLKLSRVIQEDLIEKEELMQVKGGTIPPRKCEDDDGCNNHSGEGGSVHGTNVEADQG